MTWEDERTWFLPEDLTGGPGGRPSPVLVSEVAARLWAARKAYLARLPVAEVVERVDHAVKLWLEPESPWLLRAARRIAAVTPYGETMVRQGLAELLEGCRKDALLRLLEEELGDPAVLDGFRARSGGGLHMACGPSITVHVFSGNVPGLPALSLIHALLVKSASLGKPASEEPVFPAMFARSVAAVDARLGACIGILPWPGGDRALEEAAFAAAGAVVAYGSDAAVESVRSRVPAGVRFVGHGHRVSFAVIGREALDAGAVEDLADRLAYDVSLFDQQGCVSAHVAYVERGGATAPEDFARHLAVAMAALERRMPRGAVSLEEAAAVQRARTDGELAELRGEPVRLWASHGGTAWTVLYEEDPAFVASCLNRVIRVKPVGDAAEIPGLVRPVRRHLQTVGTAMPRARQEALARALAPLGVCRVCPIGRMPHPPLTWHHDGGFSLRPLLRWTGMET
jgi:hypothetical protein